MWPWRLRTIYGGRCEHSSSQLPFGPATRQTLQMATARMYPGSVQHLWALLARTTGALEARYLEFWDGVQDLVSTRSSIYKKDGASERTVNKVERERQWTGRDISTEYSSQYSSQCSSTVQYAYSQQRPERRGTREERVGARRGREEQEGGGQCLCVVRVTVSS